MRMASVYYRGMFETRPYCLPDKVFTRDEIVSPFSTILMARVKEFMCQGDVTCKEIVYEHHKYTQEDVVVVELLDGVDELKVGVVAAIVVKDSDVFLMLRVYNAVKPSLDYYESVTIGDDYVYTAIRALADRKALKKHGTDVKFQFVFHHHVSHDQNE